ncbi:MAG: transposase [Eubacterium sp.]|nr:transposase [Eubacterium sp.]
MIRKNSLFCKIIRIKKTSVQLFNEYMLSYSWKNETCPWCASKGSCVSHGSYMRSMADFVHGKTVYGEACVQRLCCTGCGHTHAILPDVIIPYSVYGLFFILRVLAEYFLRLYTVEKLCTRFGISASMLYRWRDLFLSQKQEWLGVLVSAEAAPAAFVRSLCLMPEYSVSFACRFVLLSAHSFLQSHKNFADYRQTVF